MKFSYISGSVVGEFQEISFPWCQTNKSTMSSFPINSQRGKAPICINFPYNFDKLNITRGLKRRKLKGSKEHIFFKDSSCEMHEEKFRNEKTDDNGSDEKSSSGQGLTDEEFAVYDRQIRLWGVESQKRFELHWQYHAGFGGL